MAARCTAPALLAAILPDRCQPNVGPSRPHSLWRQTLRPSRLHATATSASREDAEAERAGARRCAAGALLSAALLLAPPAMDAMAQSVRINDDTPIVDLAKVVPAARLPGLQLELKDLERCEHSRAGTRAAFTGAPSAHGLWLRRTRTAACCTAARCTVARCTAARCVTACRLCARPPPWRAGRRGGACAC